MPSTYSTNLALELIGTGDQAGTWGATTNTNLGTLIEQAVSGYVTQAITDGADTVITIPNGTTGVARNMLIECTGALTAARNLIVPANKKLYFIYNNTTGGYAVTVKVSGQAGVSVPNGAKVLLASNGTDVVVATNYMVSLALGTALSVANGGTGATSISSGALIKGNGASAFSAASAADIVSAIGATAVQNATNATTATTSTTATTATNATNATNSTKLVTTNFTVEESGGKLIFKYGGTTIASMTSAGVFTSISTITAGGTP